MSVLSHEMLDAVHKKYPRAALLREVSLTDENASYLYRSYHAQNSVYYKRKYTLRGEDFDLFMEIPTGYDPDKAVLVRRIDGLLWEGKNRTAIEVKTSRADFFKDTEHKRSPWQKVTNRFIYLVPKGLIDVKDVPMGCGLWEYDVIEKTLTVKKSALNKPAEDFPQDMVRYLAWRAFAAQRDLSSALADGVVVRTAVRARRRSSGSKRRRR